jgi:lysozyme
VHSVRKPWWQQATALVTVSTGGVITGFTFVPGAAAAMTSPSSVPLHLLALEKAAKPADTGDDRLRPAIVNVAGYYLQLAQSRTPAQMEALIWGKDSLDGADHGPSCAAFASLTLELAAQAVGQQSWVSGGGTYPWPLHEWADVRVNPNPDSLGVTSIVQDAQAHQRWHPLSDGYQPQPGDWVVFDGHVEVVTSYADGVLDTIGADSLPNLTVNAHSFPDPLAQQGVEGFVDNGHLGESTAASSGAPAAAPAPATGSRISRGTRSSAQPQLAAIPGVVAPEASSGTGPTGSSAAGASTPGGAATGTAAPGTPAQSASGSATAQANADIPGAAVAAGLAVAAPHPSGTATAAPATPSRTSAPYRQHTAPATATPGTKSQQAFINQIAPGALAAQQRFGVPASVTIAQAIDESGWGSSQLAANDYNLFGIKGSGPAGSVTLPTQEFENGQWVTIYAQFRVYHNVSESISDHAELLATSGYYTRAMADRAVPDAFANDLTGVYATDPEYGTNLIALMRLYNLYRFDSPTASQAAVPSHTPAAHSPAGHTSGSAGSEAQPSIPGILSALSPALAGTPTPNATHTPATQPSATHPPSAQPSGPQASIPGILSVLAPAQAGTPTPSDTQTPAAQPSATQTPAPQPTGAQPSATEPSTAKPSGSPMSGAQASVPGILSVLAPEQAGTPAPGATQTPAAQPSATQTPAPQPTGAQPSAAQPSTAQPSGSELSGAQASIPGILSALAPAQAGTLTPGATQTPAAQPSVSQPSAQPAIAPTSAAQPSGAQPSAAQPPGSQPSAGQASVPQPSGSQPSAGQASVPGMMSALSPALAGTPTPGATQTPTATASPAGSPDTSSAAAAPGSAGTPGNGAAAPQGNAAAHASLAGPHGNVAASVQGAAAVPGISGATSTSSASQSNSTAAHGNYAAASQGAAAVPGTGLSAVASAPPQANAAAYESTGVYESTAAYGNSAPPYEASPAAVPGAATVPGISAGAPATSEPHASTAAYESDAAYGNRGAAAPGAAAVPGVGAAATAASAPQANSTLYGGTAAFGNSPQTVPGAAAVPGVGAAVAGFGVAGAGAAVRGATGRRSTAAAPAQPARRRAAGSQARGAARVPGVVAPAAIRYETPLPSTVATAFFAKAKGPLARAEQLHRDVAGRAGIRWQLLAACDWMQCHADHTLSPVNGERLGKHNPDGTVYQTKSQALAQCASDLIYLAGAVYGLDLTARRALPVRTLADVFAAFRWGGLLQRNGVSAMEFPYSVAGLTEQHLKMHWPVIGEPDAPDKPGSRFRGPFGAVPVLLSLSYPALV